MMSDVILYPDQSRFCFQCYDKPYKRIEMARSNCCLIEKSLNASQQPDQLVRKPEQIEMKDLRQACSS